MARKKSAFGRRKRRQPVSLSEDGCRYPMFSAGVQDFIRFRFLWPPEVCSMRQAGLFFRRFGRLRPVSKTGQTGARAAFFPSLPFFVWLPDESDRASGLNRFPPDAGSFFPGTRRSHLQAFLPVHSDWKPGTPGKTGFPFRPGKPAILSGAARSESHLSGDARKAGKQVGHLSQRRSRFRRVSPVLST